MQALPRCRCGNILLYPEETRCEMCAARRSFVLTLMAVLAGGMVLLAVTVGG